MKLAPNQKQYLTLLILILFSFAFYSCKGDIIGNIFGPENDGLPDSQNPAKFNYELWIAKSDGSELKKIADGGRLCAFLPVTNKILYLSSQSSAIGLSAINPDGSGQTFIWKNNYWNINNFSFSPDNSKILLPSTYNGLYELDSKTLGLFPVLNIEHSPVASACYSKNMTKIVCQDNFGITLLDRSVNSSANGPVIENIVTIRKSSYSGEVKSPAFIFNDTQVIYLKQAGNQLYSLRSYSLKTATDTVLISPDSIPLFGEHYEVIGGNTILCTVREYDKYLVKTIALSDNFPSVTLGEGRNFSLSPDRSKVIIYDNKSFYSINLDGTGKRLIYTELGDKAELKMASLSFDGKYIVFGRTADIIEY